MNRSAARLTLTVVAPVVLGLGLAGCSQATGRPPQTVGLSAATSPEPAGSASPRTEPAGSASPRTELAAPATPASGSASKSGPEISSTPCSAEQGWGTGPEAGGMAMSPSALYLARAGRHACYDRVVFDLNGPEAVGFAARYVPVVLADASGRPVPVPGGAALEVVVRAPIYGTDSQGHQPGRRAPAVGENLVVLSQISGWESLRAVRFAGSFEGQTTLAVGVRDRRPFRVWVSSEGSYQHVVVDIAH